MRELRAARCSLQARRRVCRGLFVRLCGRWLQLLVCVKIRRCVSRQHSNAISPSISKRSNTHNFAAAAFERWSSCSLNSRTSMTPGNAALSCATIRCHTHENTASYDTSLPSPGSILLSSDPRQSRAVWQKAFTSHQTRSHAAPSYHRIHS